MLTEREKDILKIIRENPMIKQQELADTVGITRSSVAVHVSNLTNKGYILGKGYVVKEHEYVCVVGGANMDMIGYAGGEIVGADSNPGKVKCLLGGVGRNQAHNLRLLGVDVNFVTAFGSDFNGERLKRDCIEKGINISYSITIPNTSTSTYLSIIDACGNLYVGINEMDIYDHLTPQILGTVLPMINRATVCAIDTNINRETIEFLADNVSAPIFCETISTAKAGRIRNILPKIHTLRSDLADIEQLLDMRLGSDRDIDRAIDLLLKSGIKNVYISVSSRELICANGDKRLKLAYRDAGIPSKSGSRDSFMSALIWSYIRDSGLEDSAAAGVASAIICSQGHKLVNEQLNEDYLLETMRKVREDF